MFPKEGLILFIGGAPTVGKTTIARELSEKIGIKFFSTDDIRDEVKKYWDKKSHPDLFDVDLYEAEEYLTKFSAYEIVKKQNAEGEDLWLGIRDFIENQSKEGKKQSFIVEGIDILPRLVVHYAHDLYSTKAVFLVDENVDRIRHTVFNRGLWDESHLYSDDLKEKEVEWAYLFGSTIAEEAKKYNYPVVQCDKTNDINKIMLVLGFEALI